jgi:tetratricopeptide (TPR) repeat protein
VGLYFRSRHYAEAQDLLQQFQQVTAGGLGRLAAEVSLSAREDPERTLQLARQAVSKTSGDYQDHLWLGQVLGMLPKPKEADEELRRAKEAEEELRRAVELADKRPEPWVALVQFLSTRGRRDEAKRETAKAAAKLPADTGPVALAACWEAVGDRAAAAEQYKKALASRPDDPGLHQAVSLFHLRGGETDQAVTHLRKILELRETTPSQAAAARRTLAVTLAGRGNYQRSTEALALLKENAAGGKRVSPDDQRTIALIQAFRPGDRTKAIRNLEAAFLQVPPTDDERFLLAALYAVGRDHVRTREEFTRLLTANASPNPGYIAAFVHVLIQQGELDSADHWLGELEKLRPQEPRTAALKARVLHAKALILHEKGQVLDAREKDDQAADYLRKFAAAAAKDPARQLAVGRLLDEIGKPGEAELYLRAYAQARAKEDPASSVPLIDHLGQQDRLKEALDLCEKLRGKVSDETMVPVWFRCLRAARKDEVQIRRVEAWVQADLREHPGKPLFALALANLRDLQGRDEEAEKIYRDVLGYEPRNVIALNNLAVLLAFRGNHGDEALRHIDKAIEIAGPLPGLLDSRAIVYLSQGQWQRAARDLEEVVSTVPSPSSYLRMARAYMMAGDTREARAILGKEEHWRAKLADFHPLERPVYEKFLSEHKTLLRDSGGG